MMDLFIINIQLSITEDLTWTSNTKSISKKAQQRLHFLRRLKRASLPPPILTTFYRGTIESVLTSCITVWYGNCCAADRKTLQRTVNTAAKIIGAPLPSILDIFLTRCSSKAKSIVEDPTHPSHSLFQLLPSGRRYRSIRARSARLLNSFFPQAVRALNSHHTAPLWNPKQPPPPYHISGKTVNFYLCGIQVSGPAQATCSNTLSSACTRHFHTPLCVHNPTKDWLKYTTVMYVCLLAHAPQITLHCSPASCLNVSLLHMYSIWSHLHSCTVCILFYFLVYV